VTEETRNLNVEEAWMLFKSKVLKLSGFYISSKGKKVVKQVLPKRC